MSSIQLQDPTQIYLPSNLLASLGVTAAQPSPAPARPASAQSSGTGLLTRVCGDGERTEHLTRAAGKLIADGWSQDDVIVALNAWNANNNPPLPRQKVTDTVESLFKTHARNHPFSATNNEPLQPLFDPTEADVAWMLTTRPKPQEWLLENCLPKGVVGILVAPGGTGKSMFMLQLGTSVATGLPLCDQWDVDQQGEALLIFAEDDKNVVHRRVAAIQGELALRTANFGREFQRNLHVLPRVGENNLMTRSNDRGVVTPTAYVDRLLLAARAYPNLKLVVIDPASRFRGGNENSADDWSVFIVELERIVKALGCTVLVCHHMSKGAMRADDPSQADTRGSSAATDGARWQMNLTKPSMKYMQEHMGGKVPNAVLKNFLLATVTKSNYSPPQDEVLLHRKDSGYLVAAKKAGIAVSLEDRIINLVKREAANGNSYTANQIEEKFAGEGGELGAGKERVRKLLRELVSQGTLKGGRAKAITVGTGTWTPPPAPTREELRDQLLAQATSETETQAILDAYDRAAASPMADGSMASRAPGIGSEVVKNQSLMSDGPISDHQTKHMLNQ